MALLHAAAAVDQEAQVYAAAVVDQAVLVDALDQVVADQAVTEALVITMIT